ncbi:class I SAM-dependent methyltransferase [Bosea sp. LjRoot90]|uniref:class I SAM-dependent methyltransferase n=1 Tax=Bosea sp. LjRoot90 TaxID=3342342 RepID=UPI003ECCBF56
MDHLSIRRELAPLIERYARGRVLDAGAGRMAWRSLLMARASEYLSMDYEAAHPDLSFQGDLRGGLPVDDKSIDAVFCCSVLEHIPEPWLVFAELKRIVRPGGHVILSVPFIYYLHGAPHDYFRFTRYGVTEMATKAGFEIAELKTSGGIAHMLLHAVSMVSTALLWHRRAPFLAAAPALVLFGVARLVDRLDRGGLFAQTVNVVLRQPLDTP